MCSFRGSGEQMFKFGWEPSSVFFHQPTVFLNRAAHVLLPNFTLLQAKEGGFDRLIYY